MRGPMGGRFLAARRGSRQRSRSGRARIWRLRWQSTAVERWRRAGRLCASLNLARKSEVASRLAEDMAGFDVAAAGAGEELVGFTLLALAAFVGRFFVAGDLAVEVLEEPRGGFPGAASFANHA